MVMVLHLHGLLLMYHAIWLSPIAGSVTPEMVWLSWPAITTSLASRPEPSKSRVGVARIKPSRKPPSARGTSALRAPMSDSASTVPDPTRWTLESRQSAATIADRAQAKRPLHSMGSTPASPYHSATAARPSFPWSRQPLTKHFDFDPHTGIITLSTKRCTIALLLIVAGFGCDLGHLDTGPGQGDLFDPKYKVAPLTLPQSLADSQGVLP